MRKYHGNIEAYSGTDYRAELWQGSTPDSPDASIELIITGIEFEYQGEGDRLYENPIRASRCNVGFTSHKASNRQPDQDVQANLQNIALDEEQKWALVIYKGNALYWVGRVLADQIQYKRSSEHGFICEVSAVDTLYLLEGYEVDPAWFTNSKITGIQLVTEILQKAGLDVYWNNAGAEDTYIHDAIEHTNAAATLTEKLSKIRFRDVAFVESFDPFGTEVKYKNCKKALEDLLLTFGARIIHGQGVYWITQANSYDGTSLTYNIYDNTGAVYLTGQTITHRITVNAATRPAWEAKPIISYQQPLREFVVNYKRQNAVYTQKTTYNTNTLTGSGVIPSNYPLKIQFTFDSETQPSSNFDRLVFYFRVYVKNPTSGVYYRYNSDTNTWYNLGTTAPTSSQYFEFLIQDKRINGVGERLQVATYETPAPPAGATEVYYDSFVQWQRMGRKPAWSILGSKTVWTWGAGTTVSASWKGSAAIVTAYNTSEPYKWDVPAQQSSAASSPRNLNSEKVEVTIPFYNGRVADIGNVEIYGTSWIDPGAWSVGWTANTGDIGQVLARQMMGLYRDFLPTIRGAVRDAGNYHPGRTLFFDSAIWLLNGCRFEVQSERWEGEWVRVQQVFTGINDNGEGERVRTDDEKAYDRVRDLEQALTKQVQNWTFLKEKFVQAVFDDANPTEPTADTRYNVQINYTNSDKSIAFTTAPTFSNPWTEIVKPETETVQSDTTLSNDSALQFTMLADRVYAIRAFVPMAGTATSGIKIATSGPSASSVVERCDISAPGGQLEHFIGDALGNVRQSAYPGTGNYAVKYDITLTTTAGGTFAIQWAQSSSEAANTSVLAGAYLEYKIVREAPDDFLLLETGDYMLLETGDYIILD